VFIILLDVLAYLMTNLFILLLVSASQIISLKDAVVNKLKSSQKIALKDDEAE